MFGGMLRSLLKEEFSGYSASTLRADLLAGLTIAAVSLPLALAFGVASGATASAGLITAIVGGLVIGALSGASYQVSGPSGATSAVLIALAAHYGMEGVLVAGVLAGIFLLLMGALNVGRFLSFVPSPVVMGFTSGISVIIIIGQLDNLLGIATPASDSPAKKLVWYLTYGIVPDWHAIVIASIVMVCMIAAPVKRRSIIPGSLLGILVATAFEFVVQWKVGVIGALPTSLLPEHRLSLAQIPWEGLKDLILPAITIAALVGIESLLCGEVGSRLSRKRLHANQELIAQGVGNLLLPFLGGIPATAAIARTSVGIRAGGHTRVATVVHGVVLLLSMFVLAPIISRVPLAALAGVLIVTAWRVNEWHNIRYIIDRRFKTSIAAFFVTLVATITLDLNQAILIGTLFSAIAFISQIADVKVNLNSVDPLRLRERGVVISGKCPNVNVAYVTGPIFFAATGHLREVAARASKGNVLIFSLRGVPLIDSSGVQTLEEIQSEFEEKGGTLLFAGVNDSVRLMMDRAGFTDRIGREKFFWSADQAIVFAEKFSEQRA